MSQDNSQKPGQAALENMKLLKAESAVFKVPKVPIKKADKQKTSVLDEDIYVEGIAKIIQRDFFPDLEKLKAQNDFLEATENKDYDRLREITRKYSGQRPPTEPYNSPATFDTPEIDRPQSPTMDTTRQPRLDHQAGAKAKDITDNHTLDSFLSTHTSEDNASYDKIIALEDRKRTNKHASQFDAEVTSATLALTAVELPSIEQQADQTNRPDEVQTWKYRAKNFIMYVPDGSSSQPRPAKAELQRHNTRLNVDPFDHTRSKQAISDLAKSQNTAISGKIGVDGTTAAAAQRGSPAYSLLGTPSPRPGAAADASPLMTWGEIEGTPFRLDGGDTPLPAVGSGAGYRMLEGGARERIALQLAEQVAKKRRPTTPRLVTPSPSFRSNTERLASMSPAARRLATKHLMSPHRSRLTPSSMGIFSKTPTPKRTPKQTRTPLVATPNTNKKLATPTNATNITNSVDATENLTDNLLQINVTKRDRLKAQDFFK